MHVGKKIWKKNIFLASLKSMKKGVGSEVGSGSGSISQRYGSGDSDPDPYQNVTDPQHCFFKLLTCWPFDMQLLNDRLLFCLQLRHVYFNIFTVRPVDLLTFDLVAIFVCACRLLFYMSTFNGNWTFGSCNLLIFCLLTC